MKKNTLCGGKDTKKMPRFLIRTLLALLGASILACSPINSDDFFEPEKTDKYLLDLYKGDTGFQLDDSYALRNLTRNEIFLDSNDGKGITKIVGVYLGDIDKISEKKVIVYCHDKQKNIDYYWPRIKLLAKSGADEYGVFIIDYRGYGKSAGTPNENGLYADINAALVWLEKKGLTSERLIMYGYGIGSAVAIELAANPRSLTPAKIIIESPLASIESLIQETTSQSTPRTYLSELQFNNADKIVNVSQPLLWIHGTEDNIYDISSQGQLVFDRHPGVINVDKFLYRIAGASHHDVPQNFENGLTGYEHSILTFILN